MSEVMNVGVMNVGQSAQLQIQGEISWDNKSGSLEGTLSE